MGVLQDKAFKKNKGVTLVELLVAMTIAAVVFGVVGTRMNRTLPKARDDR
ncbi:MAG: hypothetical protein DRI56_13850, partial [Chloroflexota bacterium]